MKEFLDPLVQIAGVRFAALISPDGVPIASVEASGARLEHGGPGGNLLDDFQAFAAVVAGWLGDAARLVDPLSWDAPGRVVMLASRGALVCCQGPGAVLVVMLEHGISPEELRIPMDGALARMQRVLRSMGSANQAASQSIPASQEEPRGALPSSTDVDTSGSAYPETTPASRTTGNNG